MTTATDAAAPPPRRNERRAAAVRGFIIGLTSFLTLVDLFGAQAVLPTLLERYQVDRATMGFAVNSSTIGMAVAGVLVAIFARNLPRTTGIWASLALLSVPTFFLATTGDIATFTTLRIVQGFFMATAFTLTMAYLAEECTAGEAAGAMAAYITGNVLSNLAGRLISATITDQFGLSGNFYGFALMNLAGAAFVYFCLGRATPHAAEGAPPKALEVLKAHLSIARLVAGFGIGFLILFVFIGAFTYVNYVLAAEPFALSAQALGLVYFVFLPSVLTTPIAGGVAIRFGVRPTFWASIAVSIGGLMLLIAPSLPLVLSGLALLAAGLFFAQAAVTGFVGQAATADRAAASGLYLASYYFGGLMGAVVVGQVFVAAGWAACVFTMAAALALAGAAAIVMRVTPAMRAEAGVRA